MLLLINPAYHYLVENLTEDIGSKKELVSKTLWKLENLNAADLVSMDCGSYMANFCYRSVDNGQTIIPDRKTSSGLTHFYKEGSAWKFIAEEDYAASKKSLPGLSFALRYPFSQFETKAIGLPDLEDLLQKIEVDEQALTHGSLKGASSDISAEEPLYCSVAKINGKEQRKYVSESEVLDPNHTWVMNPLIFYRVSKPAKDLSKLAAIALHKFYKQSSAEEEQIQFTVKKL